jgi:hypothetical protein
MRIVRPDIHVEGLLVRHGLSHELDGCLRKSLSDSASIHPDDGSPPKAVGAESISSRRLAVVGIARRKQLRKSPHPMSSM